MRLEGLEQAPSVENEQHAIYFLRPSGSVVRYYFKQPVEYCWPYPLPGLAQLKSHAVAIGRMASCKPEFQLPYSFWIAQRFTRRCRIAPSESEAFVGRSKTAS